MDGDELREFLEEKYLLFNTPNFIEADPISIPHSFIYKQDIEIAAFLTALIAWGKRELIIRSAKRWMELLDREPYDYVLHASAKELKSLDGFVYRTMNGGDARGLILGLRKIYEEEGGLEQVMRLEETETDTAQGILRMRELMISHSQFLPRTQKHLANPAKGSSAKRLNMFLRWMVRNDKRGVDFGLWRSLRPAQLICPLDVHTGNVARKLGLIQRKQNDWKAALELTQKLREFDPEDPVKYDFSLFGLGIYEQFA